jgi:hypothetical protein
MPTQCGAQFGPPLSSPICCAADAESKALLVELRKLVAQTEDLVSA